MIMIIAITYIFFILCYIWSTVEQNWALCQYKLQYIVARFEISQTMDSNKGCLLHMFGTVIS